MPGTNVYVQGKPAYDRCAQARICTYGVVSLYDTRLVNLRSGLPMSSYEGDQIKRTPSSSLRTPESVHALKKWKGFRGKLAKANS